MFAPRFLVILLALGAAGALAIEPTRQLIQQRQRISSMSSDLREIESANRSLAARIDRLKTPDYIEQRAREQVGLVLPGETAVVVMPPTVKEARKKASASAEAEKAPAPEPESGPIEDFLDFLGL